MKKQYIRPKSQLFMINLAENIAESSPDETVIEGGVRFQWKNNANYYSGIDGALVTGEGSLLEAYTYVISHGLTEVMGCMN